MAKRLGVAVLVTAALALASCGDAPLELERVASSVASLTTVTGFGSNPGNLAMLRYAPAGMPANAPLVVALHGCTQTADALSNIGLDALADRYKFYVVYPQQSSTNNPVSCFDWWGAYNNPSDKGNITRGKGENMSIKQMVDKTATDFSVDRSRVYVFGFSAGAAMAAVMLAAWPDVFAAGAIDAGVPYDCPSTVNNDVFQCMSPGKSLAAPDWGGRVKAAYPGYAGPYPRVTLWQGAADHTVATANQSELIKQWTNVHGLSATPTQTDMVDGYPHQTFADSSHVVQVESYAITGMDHGVAVDPAHGCGVAGQYIFDKGICSAHHILDFFGVTGAAPAPDGGTVGTDGGGHVDAGTGPGHGVDAGCCGAGDDGGASSAGDAGPGGAGDTTCGFCLQRGSSGCAAARPPHGGDGPGSSVLLALIGVALIVRQRRRA